MGEKISRLDPERRSIQAAWMIIVNVVRTVPAADRRFSSERHKKLRRVSFFIAGYQEFRTGVVGRAPKHTQNYDDDDDTFAHKREPRSPLNIGIVNKALSPPTFPEIKRNTYAGKIKNMWKTFCLFHVFSFFLSSIVSFGFRLAFVTSAL